MGEIMHQCPGGPGVTVRSRAISTRSFATRSKSLPSMPSTETWPYRGIADSCRVTGRARSPAPMAMHLRSSAHRTRLLSSVRSRGGSAETLILSVISPGKRSLSTSDIR